MSIEPESTKPDLTWPPPPVVTTKRNQPGSQPQASMPRETYPLIPILPGPRGNVLPANLEPESAPSRWRRWSRTWYVPIAGVAGCLAMAQLLRAVPGGGLYEQIATFLSGGFAFAAMPLIGVAAVQIWRSTPAYRRRAELARTPHLAPSELRSVARTQWHQAARLLRSLADGHVPGDLQLLGFQLRPAERVIADASGSYARFGSSPSGIVAWNEKQTVRTVITDQRFFVSSCRRALA